MLDPTTVVCATDLTEASNKAIYLAAFIAKSFEAKLVIAHVIDLPAVTPYGETMVDPQELKARVEEGTKSQIADILAHLGDVKWELNIALGYPAKEIQRIITDTKAGLLVAATHSRSGLERFLLGSVSRKLMFTLSVPFLIIPGALSIERTSLSRVDSMMIACDFSEDSDLALSIGFDLARRLKARLTLATVIDQNQLDQILVTDPQRDKSVADRLVSDLSSKLMAFVPDDLKEGTTVAVLAGQPHEELNKHAILNHLDLIVMGVHGRGFIENLIVGSTTDRLVRLGQFPVLAVRAHR
ncbi:MAG: universal stress protein [Deltaproteobacteria bacterium]|jgi:nucleotide-binding universal stress UspA family protein|nr:universal stress protein [Deltaproteobacteria bacterium]